MNKQMNHAHAVEKIIKERYIRRMVEIGVYKGALSRHICKTCRHIVEYYAIDPWSSKSNLTGRFLQKTEDDWDGYYKKVLSWMPYCRAYKVIRMTGVEASTLFPVKFFKGFFDFVYIDSSHYYEDTLNEIKAWLPLIREGGLMGRHDYGDQVRPEHAGVKKAVDEMFGEENIKKEIDMVWYTEIKGGS